MQYFLGLTSLEILQKTQKDLQDQNIQPEKFEDRIVFMSMFDDINWAKRGNSESCTSNSEQVKNYAKRFSRGHRSFLGPGDEEWYATHNYTPERKWNSTATEMVGGTFQRNWTSSIQGYQCFESWNSKKEKVGYVLFTSKRIHRTQSCCFS